MSAGEACTNHGPGTVEGETRGPSGPRIAHNWPIISLFSNQTPAPCAIPGSTS